jgi:threonine dehydratase
MAVEACSSIGIEIINDKKEKIDYVFCPVGSGTLLAGLMIPFYNLSPDTKIIGVEPAEACSLSLSLKNKRLTPFENFSRFCDGSSVKLAGEIPFNIITEMTTEEYTNRSFSRNNSEVNLLNIV